MASQIERRKFLATLGSAATWPPAARAQQPAIGFMSARSPEDSAHLGFLGPTAHSAANEWVAALAQRLRDVET